MIADECLEWLRFAHMDISAAQDLYIKQQNPRHRPFEIILYHCHQGAEKALKAYIVQHGKFTRDLQIHNLFILRTACEQLDANFNKPRIIGHCSSLQPFAIAIKYPSHALQLDSSIALSGINSAKRIYNFVCARLGLDEKYILEIP